ncbi:MAG: phage holin family protein [Chloroflexota bacterium]|nr:phage holin family protein [Chloroflexota bacterium]
MSKERQEERSLGDLFADLAQDTSSLVRQELHLAGSEIGERASRVGKDLGMLIAGGALLLAGLLAVIATLILALGALGLPTWLAALIVSVVFLGVGFALIARARSALKNADLIPRHTMETLKEDQEWIKEQAC